MALGATIRKCALQVSDLDRGYYGSHALTLAQHPSETEQRLMLRVLAFALHAHEDLDFGRGLSVTQEPDLWHREADGEVKLWIDLGQPDERRLRQALGRAREVVVYAYQPRSVDQWWPRLRDWALTVERLRVFTISEQEVQVLRQLAARNMDLQCTVQDGAIWLSAPDQTIELQPQRLD